MIPKNIQQFRQLYPQFEDVNDIALTRSLYEQTYGRKEKPLMSFGEFERRFMGMDVMKSTSLFPERPPPEAPPAYGFFTEKTLGGHLLEKAPAMIGGTVGGMVGIAIPTVGEEAAAVSIGAKLATFAPKLVYGPALAGVFGTTAEATSLAAKGELTREKIPQLKRTFAWEAGTEFGGNVITGTLGHFLLRPFRKTLIEGADIADEALRRSGTMTATEPKTIFGKAGRLAKRRISKIFLSNEEFIKRYGSHITSAQGTESFMDTLEAFVEGSFFGGGKLRIHKSVFQREAAKNIQNKLKSSIMRNLLDSVGPERAAGIVSDMSSASKSEIKALTRSLYSSLDELSESSVVNFSRLREIGESETKRWTKAGAYKGKIRSMLKVATDSDELGSFSTGKDKRSYFLSLERQFDKTGDRNAARIASALAGAVDESMETSAKAAGDEVYNLWRTVNNFYRGQFRYQWLSDTMKMTGDPFDKVVSGKAFMRKVNKMGGKEGLIDMGFSAIEANNILEVAQVAKLIGTKPAAGGGSMLVKLMQAGFLVQLGGSVVGGIGIATDEPALTGTGALFLIGPAVGARLMASPTGAKLLTQGLKAPAGSRTATLLGTRILREAALFEKERIAEGLPSQITSIEPVEVPDRPFPTEPTMKELRGFGGRGF